MNTTQIAWLEGEATLRVAGPCTMAGLAPLLAQIAVLKHLPKALDLAGLELLDSAGALVLLRLLNADRHYKNAIA